MDLPHIFIKRVGLNGGTASSKFVFFREIELKNAFFAGLRLTDGKLDGITRLARSFIGQAICKVVH